MADSRNHLALLVAGAGFACTLAAGAPSAAPAERAPQPSLIWSISEAATGIPAADSSRAYFLSRAHDVVAVDARTGDVRWRHNTGDIDPAVGAGVLLAGDVVLAADFNISAFDRTSGAFRWRFVPDSGFAPGPYIGDVSADLLYAGSSSGHVYAIDITSGAMRWSADLGGGDAADRTLVYPPAARGGQVYAAFVTLTTPTHGGIVALEAATGSELWRKPLPAAVHPGIGVGASGRPLVDEARAVVASRDGSIHAFDRFTGAHSWAIAPIQWWPNATHRASRVDVPRPDTRALAASGGTLFAGSLSGLVTAYDLDTGLERWRRLSDDDGSIGFDMKTDRDLLFFATWSGRLIAVNAASGDERWNVGGVQRRFIWPPFVREDVVYVSSSAGFFVFRR